MVERFYIKGGTPLKGEVSIGGAKNSVLKLMAAALLAKGESKIYNVPDLTDVDIMLSVIEQLGAKTNYDKKEKSVTIDATNITSITATYELVSKMRASFIVLGALVSRCKEAKVALPGGCAIGERRVDFHIRGLEALGAKIKIEKFFYYLLNGNKSDQFNPLFLAHLLLFVSFLLFCYYSFTILRFLTQIIF